MTWGLGIAALLFTSCGGGAKGSGPAAPLFELPAEQTAEVGSTSGPALFAGFKGVDVGWMWQGAVREVRFPLTSVGTEPVHIASLKASCGCTLVSSAVVEPDGERELVLGEPLEPGSRVLVTVRFDSRAREGQEAKLVTVYSDAPEGRLQLQLAVDTRPFLRATPDPIEFGRVFPSHQLSAETQITAPEGQAFGLQLVGVEDLPEGLRIELEPGPNAPDGSEAERAATWTVRALLSPGVEPGNLLAHITLVTDLPFEKAGNLAALNLAKGVFGPDGTPHHYLDVWTTAAVVGAVEASPPYLPFGFLAPGAMTSSSARIECFDPAMVEAFSAEPPAVELLDQDGKPLAGPAAEAFTPTLRLVTPENAGTRPLSNGALAAWDLEVAAVGFSGAGQNRIVGSVALDFAASEIPDPTMDFQVILQP